MTTSKRPRRRRSTEPAVGPRKPAEIPAAEFKATCLSLMDDVALHHRTYVVTKRGRPVARLVPVKSERVDFVGSLRGLVLDATDLAEPIGEPWEADAPQQ